MPTKNSTTIQSSSSPSSPRPPLWKVWFVAARPHTLTASISPNIVAYNAGIAFIDGVVDTDTDTGGNANANATSFFWLILEWTAFCMLMQLGTNLHNDYADFVKGADNDKRVGQARATQKGWLSPFQTAMASGLTLLVGLFLGIWFVLRIVMATATTNTYDDDDRSEQKQRIAAMVFIVVTSIFNAFAYTGGPWPLGYIGLPHFSLGYSGLGDIFVFLYFGLVATMVPPFLYIACNNAPDTKNNSDELHNLLWTFAPYAIQVAVLATNIIVVNNLRDRHTDVLANKRTLAVRFGATFCRVEYGINVFVAYGLVLVLWNDNNNFSSPSVYSLLPLLSFPLAWKEWRALYKKNGSALNEHVGGAAKVQFVFCILLAISIRISS